MAQINIKLTDEQKNEVTELAKSKNISVKQLFLESILDIPKKVDDIDENIDVYTEVEKDIPNIDEKVESVYKEMYETLKEQLEQKDLQIDQLHKIIYNKDTLRIEMTNQKRHWWEFWKTTKVD